MSDMSNQSPLGQAIKRKEDYRFLTGGGRYTDDIKLDNQACAFFLRSPYAHARIKGYKLDEAEAAPGVLGILTGTEIKASGIGGLPCGWLITDVNGQPMKEPPHPVLAIDKVRFVGEGVALIVAETLAQAKAAAALIEVDYEVLPAVVKGPDAVKPGAPQVHDDAAPNNTSYVWQIGDKAATDAAVAKAHHVTRLEFDNNRLVPNAIEPRAAIAHFDRANDQYTLYVSNQNPHVERL